MGLRNVFRGFGSDSLVGSILMMVKSELDYLERVAERGAKHFRACLPANFRLQLPSTGVPYFCLTIISDEQPIFIILANSRQS